MDKPFSSSLTTSRPNTSLVPTPVTTRHVSWYFRGRRDTATRYTRMPRILAVLIILATGTVSANDALRPFFERPLEQIDGVTIQQSWLLGTPQSREHAGSLLFKDNQVLVVVEENKTPKEKKPNWVVRNVQTLGAKADGKYLSSCYTEEGLSGDYIVLVDKNVFTETTEEYYSFKKIWKFNRQALQFEAIAAKQLRCQCDDCPK